MEITSHRTQNTARLTLVGTIDEKGADAMKTAFLNLNQGTLTHFTLDFGQVSHIGSAGLGKLLLFYKRLSAANIKMTVENAPATIASMFKELRMDTLFEVK